MKKIFKSIFVVISILASSINIFAVAVSDNDGSAFITKAEYDSLKSNFQSQIDSYNASIDSKIDTAIASYLGGTKLSKTQTITSNFKSINNSNNWEGIKNLKKDDIVKYFGTVSRANWIYGGTALIAAWDTAVYLDNLTSHVWLEWNDTTNTNPQYLSQCGLGWSMSRHTLTRNGEGYGLWGNGSGIISATENTYVNVSDSMFSRYQFSNANTVVWYEQRGNLRYGDIYLNDNTSNFRQFGFCQRGSTARNNLVKAWRKYCGCTTDVIDIPADVVEAGEFPDSLWVANGVLNEVASGRTTVKIGQLSATLNSGKEINFISKSNPEVLLYDNEKKFFKVYPDTELDYSELVSNHQHAVYGMTDDVFTSERVEHDLFVLVPVIGPKNIENSSSNYFHLQNLRMNKYEQLQNNKSERLYAADGIPLAYINNAGKGTFSIKIKNNSSSETFTDFEVYLSKKPFSSAATSDIIDITSLKVGDVDVSYVPVNQETKIAFSLDGESQIYLWWQAKDEDYGGMLVEVSDIEWTSSE